MVIASMSQDSLDGSKRKRKSCAAAMSATELIEAMDHGAQTVGPTFFMMGNYSQLTFKQVPCVPSLVRMAPLLNILFTLAPNGVLNYLMLQRALEALVSKWPRINPGGAPPLQWAALEAQGIRVAMAHCRGLVQVPRRLEQRLRMSTREDAFALREMLALYKPPAGNVWDAEVGSPTDMPLKRPRTLRTVATDELDFNLSPGKHSTTKTQASNTSTSSNSSTLPPALFIGSTASSQRPLDPLLLLEALMADPANPASKACRKKPAAQEAQPQQQEDSGGDAGEEDPEEEEAEEDPEEEDEEEQEDEEEEDPEEEEEEATVEPQVPARHLRITKATGRSYITEQDLEGKWRLVVEINQNQSMDHLDLIERIAQAMRRDPQMDKTCALRMRKELVGV